MTEPSAGPNGKVVVLTIAGGTTTTINVNPDKSGGSSDVAIFGTTVYFANQSGGSVTAVPLPLVNDNTTSIKVDLGARALAVDTLDKLLLVTNQGSGTVVLIDLNTNQVVSRINAVRGPHEPEGEVHDDHADRDEAENEPTIASISPMSVNAGSTFDLNITGTNLTGATDVMFIDPATLAGNGHAHEGKDGHGPAGTRDPNITVSNIEVNATGTQLTASVTNAAADTKGQRLVRVQTPNGDTSSTLSSANTFQIN
jgi:YVTN family beta-propeller protein